MSCWFNEVVSSINILYFCAPLIYYPIVFILMLPLLFFYRFIVKPIIGKII